MLCFPWTVAHSVFVVLFVQVSHYICDELDGHEYVSTGAVAYKTKRVSEAYFLDSIRVGSLRYEPSYLVAFPGSSGGQKRSAADVLAHGSALVPKKSASKQKDLRPRVDQFFHQREECHVFHSDGVFWDATLNQTNISANNNKFYIIQLLQMNDGTFTVWNRWGRQGYGGQSKAFDNLTLSQAKAEFSKKFSDKTKNRWSDGWAGYTPVPGRYTWLEMDLESEHVEEEEEVLKPASKSPSSSSSSSSSSTSRIKRVAASSMDMDEDHSSASTSHPSSASSSSSLTLSKPSGPVVCTLDPRVADLVQMIFDNSMMTKTVAAMNYDVKKQPLGKLSKLTIKKALAVLKEIEDLLTSGTSSQAKISDCSNRFYTLIPHSSGKMRLPYIDNLVILGEKLDLLDTLDEIDAAAKLKKQDDASGDARIHPLDRYYSQLHMNLKALDKTSKTYTILEKWVKQTHAPTHTDYKLKILDIFEVDRPKDTEQFVPFEDLHNQTLLWHGSRMSNWVGILSQGLRIAPPEAPVTGYMFGKGVYFADSVSKSANYCATSKNDNIGFLMACQVALGDTYDRTAADFIKQLPPKFQSCKGVGLSEPDPKEMVTLDDGVQVPLGHLVPSHNVKKSDLLYNEFIVYDIGQIKFRYFFKFQFMYK